MPQTAAKGETLTEVPFPPGAPKPHEIAQWAIWLQSATVTADLNDVAAGRIPEGKFQPLWTPSALELPPRLRPPSAAPEAAEDIKGERKGCTQQQT